MSRASRFVRNVSSNYVVTGVDGLIFILLTPFVVHSLGLEHYAVWVILQTIGYYLDFFDIGVPDAQVRQQAILLGKKDLRALSRLNGTVFVLYLWAGAAALATAALIAALPTMQLLDIPSSAGSQFVPVLLLIGLTAVFSFLETGLDGIFEGYQRYDVMNAVHLVFAVLSALATVAVLAAGYGLVALAVIALLDTVLSAVAKMFVVARLFPAEARPHLGFDRASWRSIKNYSLWNCLNDFMTEGTAQFDRIFIPILLASALVTPYSLVVALAAAIFVLAEPITDTFLPIAASRHDRNDRQGMTAFLLRGTKLVTLATLPVAVIVVFFGQAILALWVGPEYTNISASVLWFTAGNFFFSTWLWTSLNVLMGAGEMRRVFRLSVIEVTLVLVLILSLVPFMGLPGLALAGLLANVVTGALLFVPAACRMTTLHPAAFLLRGFVYPFVAGIPGYATAWLVSRWLEPSSWLEMGLAVAMTGMVSFAALLAFATSPRERARYYVTVRRLLGAG